MSELVFYTNPQSRGRTVRWMLEECGAQYRTEVIAYGPQMKSQPYLGINPMGKVPALVYAGKVVTECPAIIAFLADLYPAARLAPPPAQRQDYFRWLFFAAGPLEAASTNKFLGFTVPADRERMAGYGNFDLVIATLAQAVSKAPYIAGDTFTAADVYAGSHIGWGLEFGTLPDREEFRAYFARIKDRPARLRANALDDALVTPVA
jgi:glutathione S-transferase